MRKVYADNINQENNMCAMRNSGGVLQAGFYYVVWYLRDTLQEASW